MKRNDEIPASQQSVDNTPGIRPVSTASALALIVAVVLIITFIAAGMCGNIFSCQ